MKKTKIPKVKVPNPQGSPEKAMHLDDVAKCLLLSSEELGNLMLSEMQSRWRELNLPYSELCITAPDGTKAAILLLGDPKEAFKPIKRKNKARKSVKKIA